MSNQKELFSFDPEPQPSFHNTVHLEGKELAKEESNCQNQEVRILKIFESNDKLSPYDVYLIYKRLYAEIPCTSCRRSISNLTKQGKLEKLDEFKEGEFGMKTHLWRIV